MTANKSSGLGPVPNGPSQTGKISGNGRGNHPPKTPPVVPKLKSK